MEDVLPLLILIDETSPTESVIRKLRNFLLAAAISPSVHNVIGVMTDAVRCITWESLFPYVEDLFRDPNYATLIRSAAMFTFCQVQLHRQTDKTDEPPKKIDQCCRIEADIAKRDWLAAMFQLMTTYQESLMEPSLKYGPYVDQLEDVLHDATRILPDRERVQLYTVLRPDYCPGQDLYNGAFETHTQDAAYQVDLILDPSTELKQRTDLTLVAMGLKRMSERSEKQHRDIVGMEMMFYNELYRAFPGSFAAKRPLLC